MKESLAYGDSEHYWLRSDGTALRVASHEEFMRRFLRQHNLHLDLEDAYEAAFQEGFIRVTITQNGIYIQTSFEPQSIKMTRPQKTWLVDKSFDYGFEGTIKNLMGLNITSRILFREYFDYL